MRPQYLIIHHSETKDGSAKDWASIRRFHVNVRGWSDIGYHYGVEAIKGVVGVFVGRSEDKTGAHCIDLGMNSKSLGICLVGNYDKEPPTEDGLTVLRSLCQTLMTIHSIPVSNVLGHREVQQMAGNVTKTCPGNMFNMNEFRKSLEPNYETSETA